MKRKSKLDNIKKLKSSIKNNFSYASVLTEFELKPLGSNYKTLQNRIDNFKIDISHFTGQAHNKNKKLGPKRKIEEYLSNRYPIRSHNLKLRLYKEGLKIKQCEECGITNWNNKKLSFELDHINGDSKNNKITNLKILCPNCHSQTPTFRRNKKSL